MCRMKRRSPTSRKISWLRVWKGLSDKQKEMTNQRAPSFLKRLVVRPGKRSFGIYRVLQACQAGTASTRGTFCARMSCLAGFVKTMGCQH